MCRARAGPVVSATASRCLIAIRDLSVFPSMYWFGLPEDRRRLALDRVWRACSQSLGLLLVFCLSCGSFTGPLVSGILIAETPSSREDRESSPEQEEEAIGSPVATPDRPQRDAERRDEPAVQLLVNATHVQRAIAWSHLARVPFRLAGHLLAPATTAPLLC